MKAHVYLLGLALLCSACAAPSLRYKKEADHLIAAGKFKEADELVASKKNKLYSQKDATLLYLDRAVLLHDAQEPAQSDVFFASAQQHIDELYAKSVSRSVGRLLINDLTTPYYASPYEQALTYYYRALNFLQQDDLSAAGVEARRAVFFLDGLRGEKKSGYNDDPFVQYFASLVFESVGQLSDARIARTNAFNAYARLGGKLGLSAPDFPVPSNAAQLGEVIVIHYNGLMPLKRTETFQVAWDRAVMIAASAQEGEAVSPEVQNALRAGLAGSAVTLSFPAFEPMRSRVASSFVQAGGQLYYTQKVADFAAAAKLDLEERMPGILFRAAARAVAKQAAAVQARHAAAQASKDDNVGDLAGMIVSVLGAALEKADTRQWFTLPAEVRMARVFVAPGVQNIRVSFRDGYGNIIGERVFENIRVRRGGRVFLHCRTAE